MEQGHQTPRLLLSAREAAKALSICEKTLWSLTRSGELSDKHRRTKFVGVRLTSIEYKRLMQDAKKAGCTPTEFLRRCRLER